jgi:hypothetical protein
MKIGDWVFVKEIYQKTDYRTRKVGDIYQIGYSINCHPVNNCSKIHFPDSETPGCYEFELILASKNVLRFYGKIKKNS